MLSPSTSVSPAKSHSTNCSICTVRQIQTPVWIEEGASGYTTCGLCCSEITLLTELPLHINFLAGSSDTTWKINTRFRSEKIKYSELSPGFVSLIIIIILGWVCWPIPSSKIKPSSYLVLGLPGSRLPIGWQYESCVGALSDGILCTGSSPFFFLSCICPSNFLIPSCRPFLVSQSTTCYLYRRNHISAAFTFNIVTVAR
jgi:hypothetical protein